LHACEQSKFVCEPKDFSQFVSLRIFWVKKKKEEEKKVKMEVFIGATSTLQSATPS